MSEERKTEQKQPQPETPHPFYEPRTLRPPLSECGVSTHSIIPPPRGAWRAGGKIRPFPQKTICITVEAVLQ